MKQILYYSKYIIEWLIQICRRFYYYFMFEYEEKEKKVVVYINQETKVMAVDNILHMIENYKNCSVCRMIVLVWLIDDEWVYRRIIDGICALQLEPVSVTLLCGEEQLIQRWRLDKTC